MAYILEGDALVHYPEEPEGGPQLGEEEYTTFMNELTNALHIGSGVPNRHEVALFMEWAEHQISTEQVIERSGAKNTKDFCEKAMDLVQKLENIGSSYTLPKAWAIRGRVVTALVDEEIPPPTFRGAPNEVKLRKAMKGAREVTIEEAHKCKVEFNRIHMPMVRAFNEADFGTHLAPAKEYMSRSTRRPMRTRYESDEAYLERSEVYIAEAKAYNASLKEKEAPVKFIHPVTGRTHGREPNKNSDSFDGEVTFSRMWPRALTRTDLEALERPLAGGGKPEPAKDSFEEMLERVKEVSGGRTLVHEGIGLTVMNTGAINRVDFIGEPTFTGAALEVQTDGVLEINVDVILPGKVRPISIDVTFTEDARDLPLAAEDPPKLYTSLVPSGVNIDATVARNDTYLDITAGGPPDPYTNLELSGSGNYLDINGQRLELPTPGSWRIQDDGEGGWYVVDLSACKDASNNEYDG